MYNVLKMIAPKQKQNKKSNDIHELTFCEDIFN